MSENPGGTARRPADGEAPLLPGGEPDQAGTGPQGALRSEGGVHPNEGVHAEYDQPSGATTTDGVFSPAVNRGVEDSGNEGRDESVSEV